uniref:Guanylate cyclase domain-containing protein n=1 Tax=Heterorhabditis bacteriophora TaxID=37862 RepID=A0A1I7X874_HETBA
MLGQIYFLVALFVAKLIEICTLKKPKGKIFFESSIISYIIKDLLFVAELNDSSAAVYNAGGVTSALSMHKWNIILGVEHDLYEMLNVFVTTWEEELQFVRRQLLDSSLLQLGKKVRYDTFGVISLSIPKAFMGVHVTLEALLRKYFCMEVIRDATCDRCKKISGKGDSGLFKKQGFSKVGVVYIGVYFNFI